MGFFSWKTSDTKETIWNRHSSKGATPCKLLGPGRDPIICLDYNGYGDFGDDGDLVDYYAELDRMNGGPGDRDAGIKLAFSGKDHLQPRLVSIDCNLSWEEVPDSPICPTQGYFGWDDE